MSRTYHFRSQTTLFTSVAELCNLPTGGFNRAVDNYMTGDNQLRLIKFFLATFWGREKWERNTSCQIERNYRHRLNFFVFNFKAVFRYESLLTDRFNDCRCVRRFVQPVCCKCAHKFGCLVWFLCVSNKLSLTLCYYCTYSYCFRSSCFDLILNRLDIIEFGMHVLNTLYVTTAINCRFASFPAQSRYVIARLAVES